jgi:ribonuclease-3
MSATDTGGERAADWVRRQLRYEPADATLFEQALTHRSAARANNERLEFLGDAVLNLIVAQHLYAQYPEADEGALSRLRAAVVSGDSLARLAGPLELGPALALGAGELKSGGERRESILADALEAVCGAVYLEAGFETARRVFLRVLAPALEAMDAAAAEAPEARRSQGPPAGMAAGARTAAAALHRGAVEGESHAQTFHVSCAVPALNSSAQGVGLSRRRANRPPRSCCWRSSAP